MNIKNQMADKIRTAFTPHHIEIFDESHKHAGHSGNPDGKSETHIGIVIVSDCFAGKSRIDRARSVHSLLAEEIKQIHALTLLKTMTVAEFNK